MGFWGETKMSQQKHLDGLVLAERSWSGDGEIGLAERPAITTDTGQVSLDELAGLPDGQNAAAIGDVTASDGDMVRRLTVKWFDPVKGFGFARPDDGTADAFLHISVLHRIGLTAVVEGAFLTAKVETGVKGPQVLEVLEVKTLEDPAGNEDGPHLEGAIKWFRADKGFGFVLADDGGKDIFVHKSLLRRCGVTDVIPGQRVRMLVQPVAKGREAVWLALLSTPSI